MHTTQNPIRIDGNRTANPTLIENRWQYNQNLRTHNLYTTLLSLCYPLLCSVFCCIGHSVCRQNGQKITWARDRHQFIGLFFCHIMRRQIFESTTSMWVNNTRTYARNIESLFRNKCQRTRNNWG